ncbi:MAG: aldo/keto reductase [Frankia sp.]
MKPKANSERSRAGRPTSTEAARLTERLRRAAVDTFLEYGYDGTTMEAVAQAAGITKSTLYGRYPDKRTLFIAVSSWALTRQERDERVLEPLPDDLGGALTVIARAILSRSVDPDIVRLSRMAIAESARFPEFAASSQAVAWSPRIQMIMDLLRRHERAGTVVVKDIELAAEQFFAMVGAMPAWLAAYGIYRTPDVEEQHLHHAVALFLNGVLVREDANRAPAALAAGHQPAHLETISEMTTGTVTDAVSTPAGLSGSMESRRLGRSGLSVARLGLATRAIGLPGGGRDAQTATALIHHYLDAGGNFLDAGDGYGASEEICGQALLNRRSHVVLATKVGPPTGRDLHSAGNNRRHIRAACEASLRRLQTDYIDLYQIDFDDLATPLEETIGALDDLVRAGKVLYVGASNFDAYRLMKALSVSDRLGRARLISLQGRYTLADRTLEREHFPLLDEEGLGFVSASPLASHPPTGPIEPGLRVAATVRKAAAELGCTAAQLALAWQSTRPVTSMIVEAHTVAALEGSLAALSIEIPTDIATELDQVTQAAQAT